MKQHTIQRPVSQGIVILDYGSQYTLLIARRLRELGVYAEIIDGMSEIPPHDFRMLGVILSGGPDTVTEEGARTLPDWVRHTSLPVLGICYGMQLMAGVSGGKLRSGAQREYGSSRLILELDRAPTYARSLRKLSKQQIVWMSHGDDVEDSSGDFEVLGRTQEGVTAVIAHKMRPWIGLQFHPEVQHSEEGTELLKCFISEICQAPLNWDAGCMLNSSTSKIKENVGDGKVLMAVSGGVDSTVAAALLTHALGHDRVHAVFVDHGLLRKGEASWVSEQLKSLNVQLTVLDRREEFYASLHDISDPEEKRKIIGRKFIEVFEIFAKEQEGFTHLGQGTLYPDVIESAGHGSGAKVIKSHHNVGGLPEKLHLKLVEPFRYFFKDEVRNIGKQLGIAPQLIDRHPFPGPGLAVRILGAVDKEKIRILQEADDIFIRRLRADNFYHSVWQAFAVLLPVKSVGVMGDNRTYQQTCALRAVTTSDGMTAGVGDLPLSFLVSVSDEIIRKVNGINRVVYDITTKPPATIEWE